jgi:hypothetical protein
MNIAGEVLLRWLLGFAMRIGAHLGGKAKPEDSRNSVWFRVSIHVQDDVI